MLTRTFYDIISKIIIHSYLSIVIVNIEIFKFNKVILDMQLFKVDWIGMDNLKLIDFGFIRYVREVYFEMGE